MDMGKNCNSYRALIRDFICSPYFKDKPIYGKPMEYWSSGNIYSESEKALSQDKEWQRYTTQINNSPSNLRRLFISKEYLVLQHYVPVSNVKYTSQKALLWCVKTEDYCRSRGYTNFQANTDSILLCLDDRWKQANIEEVYVDELFLTQQQQQQQANKRVVQQLMSYSDAGGKVFPRFKAVYYVPQLGTQLLEAIKKMDKGELPYKAFVGMKVIQKQTPQWGRFSLRPSDYIFDKKGGKLDQYAQQIIEVEKAKLQEAKKIALQQKFTEQEKEQEKGKLEEIFETLDEKFIKEILFEGFSTEQKAEVIQEFTAQGKKKYGSLLELKEG